MIIFDVAHDVRLVVDRGAAKSYEKHLADVAPERKILLRVLRAWVLLCAGSEREEADAQEEEKSMSNCVHALSCIGPFERDAVEYGAA